MATAIKDETPVSEDSALGTMALYQKQQMDRQEKLDLTMFGYSLLAILQMLWYWEKLENHIEKRDCAIGSYVSKEEDREGNKGMLGFLYDIEEKRDTVDWGILKEKRDILSKINFADWEPNACSTSMCYVDDLANDVKTIDKMEEMFADHSRAGIPDGWGIHDGSLALGLGAAYSGPIMNMASVEMYEEFKQHVIPIVQQAQMSMKGIYNISSIMKYYEQAISIHEGLGVMYLQGFNSAGAMLGTALGQLTKSASGSGSTMTFNSSSVSGSSSTVHPVGMIGGVR